MDTLEHTFGKCNFTLFPPAGFVQPEFSQKLQPPRLEKCCSFRPGAEAGATFGRESVFTSGSVVAFHDTETEQQRYFVAREEVTAVAFQEGSSQPSSARPQSSGSALGQVPASGRNSSGGEK
jgi:hypothetical protein